MQNYEIIKGIEKEGFYKLIKYGIISPNIERDLAIYEKFCFLRSEKVAIMLCYEELSSMYYTDSENIRKIVAKLAK